jgi:hypothetical protein
MFHQSFIKKNNYLFSKHFAANSVQRPFEQWNEIWLKSVQTRTTQNKNYEKMGMFI